ncbi:MAG: DegT/DnrJ/EryC1/StrS family aminotransferase [Magnetococcales bacterium]|nr:DegT/DnrJ/EryC1/StrS family aminotransferase [Magnetococcales bacterium]
MSHEPPPIYVTRPYLPPLESFVPLLEEIWENQILTNCGPFHQKFEAALRQHLGVEHIALFANGTIALVVALQALRITGEVITTPFSFVATAHSLLWNGIKPVFVDIDPNTLNLDPERIEVAITPHTTALLPVHCYGTPCDVANIGRIADLYNLRVIYDAAHAFGVRHQGMSLLRHGDLSVLSFHATKIFHTFEGGAIVCPDEKTKQRIDHLKNFGFADEVTVVAPGINGKLNEVSSAFGLLSLEHLHLAQARRQAIDARYRRELATIPGIRLVQIQPGAEHNYPHFPILIEPGYGLSRDDLNLKMRAHGIITRRYFYPLISNMPMYRNLPSASPANLPVANEMALKVLCLPIYPELSDADQTRIIGLVRDSA